MLADILRTKSEYKEICRDIEDNRLGHAYVLVAQDKEIGKEFFKLICKKILYKYGFTDKENIDYKIAHSLHPDVGVYDERINVALLEEFVLDVYKKGMESDFKLYLFDTINTPLEIRAQNKMLKVYEEPPKNVAIFILTKSESTLLQTINSRAKKIYLSSLEEEEIAIILKSEGVESEKAYGAAKVSKDSLSFARMLTQDKYTEILEEVIKTLSKADHSSKVANSLDSLIFKKENINVALDFFEIVLSEKANELSSKKSKTYFSEKIKGIKGFSLASIALSIKSILNARRQLNSNLSALSVAESLMLNILEAKYKWQ